MDLQLKEYGKGVKEDRGREIMNHLKKWMICYSTSSIKNSIHRHDHMKLTPEHAVIGFEQQVGIAFWPFFAFRNSEIQNLLTEGVQCNNAMKS